MITKAILFDLDGTLLNTAPDFTSALNQLRTEQSFPALSEASIKPLISQGSNAMVKFACEIDEKHPTFKSLKNKFLTIYQNNSAQSRFYPNIAEVLAYLATNDIPWGIVTNKLTQYTLPIIDQLFLTKPGCVVCGDTLPTCKPDPAPILHACQLIGASPQETLYLGDAITDVLASNAAGTRSLVALYGYIDPIDNPHTWPAAGYIKDPQEILQWL